MADQSYSSSNGVVRVDGAVPTERDITSAGTLCSLVTGSQRFTLTGVSVIITDPTTGVSTITVKRNKTIDGTATDIGTLTIPTGAVEGSVYTREFSQDIQPGEHVVVTNNATPTAGNAFAVIEGYSSDFLSSTDGTAKPDGGTGSVFKVTS
jgi:hypothetical protein